MDGQQPTHADRAHSSAQAARAMAAESSSANHEGLAMAEEGSTPTNQVPSDMGDPSDGTPGSTADEPMIQETIGDLITGPQARPWVRLLICDHLGPRARLALSHTSKEAKNMLLVTAQHATVSFCDTTAGGSPWTAAQLRNTCRDLQTRSPRSTRLNLVTQDLEQLSYALGELRGGMSALDVLCINLSSGEPLPSVLLVEAGGSCPRLQQLHICSGLHELPSPKVFPNIKLLYLGLYVPYREDDPHRHEENVRRVCSSIAPFIKQLNTLTFGLPVWELSPASTALLFSPANMIGTHLHTLNITPCTLDDTLLGWVLQCAPAVQHLLVNHIQLTSDIHASAQPLWKQLGCLVLRLSSLACLPLPPGIELWFRDSPWPGNGPAMYCNLTSLPEAVTARLKDVHIGLGLALSVQKAYMQGGEVAVADEPAALRVALGVLRGCFRRKIESEDLPVMKLHGWTMTTEVMAELRGLPRWEEFHIRQPQWLPEPQPYGALLSQLPDSFTCVSICVERLLSRTQLVQVFLGAPDDRTADNPLHVKLEGWHRGLKEATQQLIREAHRFPNVRVGFYPARARY